jgi:hypothetical protein
MIVKDKIFLIALLLFAIIGFVVSKCESVRCDPKWPYIRKLVNTLDTSDSIRSIFVLPSSNQEQLVKNVFEINDGGTISAIRMMIKDRKRGYAGKRTIWSTKLKVTFFSGDSLFISLNKVSFGESTYNTYIDFAPRRCSDDDVFYSSTLGDFLEDAVSASLN